MVSAALLLSAVAWAPYGLTHWPRHVAAAGIASIVVLGLVCTALAFVLFFEQFTAGMGIGFPLILIGSVLAARTGRPASTAGAPR